MNKLSHKGKTYEYPNEVNVGMFQSVINIIQDMPELVTEENMTAGKFAGHLSNKNKLIPLVATLINAKDEEVSELPINKAIEICNNFFYSNGFWLMISNHFSMPSEVQEMMENPPTNPTQTTLSQNSEASATDGNPKKMAKQNTESD